MAARNWIDLVDQGVVLGEMKGPDNTARLILIDMNNTADAAQLAALGFVAMREASPKYSQGIYFRADTSFPLHAKRLARAFGLEHCPIRPMDDAEIARTLKTQAKEKFERNLDALVKQARAIGTNRAGQTVYESPTGRFVRPTADDALHEAQARGRALGHATFLRLAGEDEPALREADLRACAEGFVYEAQHGAKLTWTMFKHFAATIHQSPGGPRTPPDEAFLHRLQEAVQAAAVRRFVAGHQGGDLGRPDAFNVATDLYYGLPAERMRTGESISLQQFSTPLPMGAVAQRLLLDGAVDTQGKRVLEPTIGMASLVSLLPADMAVTGVELDDRRLAAALDVHRDRATPLNVHAGDALRVNFEEVMGGKADYVLANPPFGQLPEPVAFDKLPRVMRQDHLILLRSLAARKDEGRAVFIIGSDDHLGNGELRGSSKYLFQYLADHYELLGATEIDGRMYARAGASVPVRMLVIGRRRAEPIQAEIPSTLPVVTDYAGLWKWAEEMLEKHAVAQEMQQSGLEATQSPAPGAEARASGTARESSQRGSEDAPAAPRALPEGSIEEALKTATRAHKAAPWRLTQAVWDQERGQAAANGNVARVEELEFGVTDWARQALLAAKESGTALSESDRAEYAQRLATPVTHRDVIEKALSAGLAVPLDALRDYEDLYQNATRRKNEFQVPYQCASKIGGGETDAMVPINLAAGIYAALNKLEARHGPVDQFVADRLGYSIEEIEEGKLFSPDQIDSLALAIESAENGSGCINMDMTGRGKGRWVSGMARYGVRHGLTPVFLTLKPELFTDLFRDIKDIGALEDFDRVFILNEGVSIKRYGSAHEELFPATSTAERRAAIASGAVDPDVKMILATYSQFARAYENNPKSAFLGNVAQGNLLILDEAHKAAGASNIHHAVSLAVDASHSTQYSSATAIKTAENYGIYRKIFPSTVDTSHLSDTLKAGGEALLEALSNNLAEDGVIIRREHDLSRLTFRTYLPPSERQARNLEWAAQLSDVLSRMAALSGDVESAARAMNRQFREQYENLPNKLRDGKRLNASAMSFGSRMYQINRQFLLALKTDDAVDAALEALANGRKPVIAVENTGESLLNQVLARRTGAAELADEYDALMAVEEDLDDAGRERLATIEREIDERMKSATLDPPPHFAELLEVMLDRLQTITVRSGYGQVRKETIQNQDWLDMQEAVREDIRALPVMPLAAIDIVHARLAQHGYDMAEISGRKASLKPVTSPAVSGPGGDLGAWAVNFHKKPDPVPLIAGFQNGTFDAITITRSGSTGISLHATDRFADSDIRQRDFIVLQKAADINEFLQWLGRVDRRDQVIPPIITTIESGLPAELRLTMMHNQKLHKLSANITSNRENANVIEGVDLLNKVGDQIAIEWLRENPDLAYQMNIDPPNDDSEGTRRDMDSDREATWYINKALMYLPMLHPDDQARVFDTLSERFHDKIEELEQRGQNPFRVPVMDIKGRLESEEALHAGVLHTTQSAFDRPVTLSTYAYERTTYPIRSSDLFDRVEKSLRRHQLEETPLQNTAAYIERLRKRAPSWLASYVPMEKRDLRLKDESDAEFVKRLLSHEDEKKLGALPQMAERWAWLQDNLPYFRPGQVIQTTTPEGTPREGVVVDVTFPPPHEATGAANDSRFLPSKYRLSVVHPGDDHPSSLSMATLRSADIDLRIKAGKLFRRGKVSGNQNIPPEPYWFSELQSSFDTKPEGKVTEQINVLGGNIYRAVELALSQQLGQIALFTTQDADRKRGVVLHPKIDKESLRNQPVALKTSEAVEYLIRMRTKLMMNHCAANQETLRLSARITNKPVRTYERGSVVEISACEQHPAYRLTMPGTKKHAGALLNDGRIFDLGAKSTSDSLNIVLEGTKSAMRGNLWDDKKLKALLEILSKRNHVVTFYIPYPDQEVLNEMRNSYVNESHSHPATILNGIESKEPTFNKTAKHISLDA